METTFQEILNKNPCGIEIEFGKKINGWQKLIEFYKPKNFDETVTIKEIIKSNGIKDAVWALRCIENEEDLKKIYLFCADVAGSVLSTFENKHPIDFRPRNAINSIRLYVKGEITLENLKTAADSADSAADSAYYAASTAYYAADAAYSAADFVVYSTANSAYSAADAAYYSAYYAADSAYSVAYYAADSAADSAKKDKWEEIEGILMKYLTC